MGLVKEFRSFAVRGNIIDLAVGVIIGGAFSPIVTSLVNDIVMPPIGVLLGEVDFKDLKVVLINAVMEGEKVAKPAVTINYGTFINTVINFVIVAFCIFIAMKMVNRLRKQEEAAPTVPPAPTKEEQLLTEIRDALVQKNS
jgi:large conductance mechanosensitive channel